MSELSRTLVALLVAAFICSPALAAPPVPADQKEDREHIIRVSGQGEVEMTPDLGIISLSVETEAKTAADAQQDAAKRMQEIIRALRALNVPENKIRTTNINIYPVYPPPPKERAAGEPLKPIGYRSSNSIRVEVADPQRIGPVIDRSLEAGANRVSDISFGVADQETPRMKALARAAANAEEKAKSIADALGLKLGPVLSVVEGGVTSPPPPMYRGMGMAMEGAPTPVMPGTTKLTAMVTVEFRVTPK